MPEKYLIIIHQARLRLGMELGDLWISEQTAQFSSDSWSGEGRVVKFKCPRFLGNQKISEDNQELRPGCPPDYQIFCERIDPKIFIPTNLALTDPQLKVS